MDRNKILENQQKLTNQLNSLLETSANSLLCGPDCQREQNLTSLRQKYLDAQTNVQIAPLHLEESRKNYVTLKDGEAAYNQMRLDELEKEAGGVVKEIGLKLIEQVKNVALLNQYLDTELTNSENTQELLQEYIVKDETLETGYRDKIDRLVTNDRKSYYETQELERLQSWSTILTAIYYICLIILSIEIVFSDHLHMAAKFIILCILYFYPFTISWFVGLLYKFLTNIMNSFYYFFPKNAYTDI